MASPDFRTAFRNVLQFGIKIVQLAKSHVITSMVKFNKAAADLSIKKV